jgi:Flp pilus assembly pilin Flp
MRRLWRNARDDRGAAMVEFALVMPILLLVLLGIMDFGRALNYWINETHLANQGARWAVVNRNPGESDSESLQQYLLKQGATSELRDIAEVCIELPDGELVGDPVVVRVSADFSFTLVDAALTIVGLEGVGDVGISGSATMRLEALPTKYEAGCEVLAP